MAKDKKKKKKKKKSAVKRVKPLDIPLTDKSPSSVVATPSFLKKKEPPSIEPTPSPVMEEPPSIEPTPPPVMEEPPSIEPTPPPVMKEPPSLEPTPPPVIEEPVSVETPPLEEKPSVEVPEEKKEEITAEFSDFLSDMKKKIREDDE